MQFKILICLLLFSITLAIYWPVGHFDSVNLDDPFFIANTEAPPGLNWLSFERAMTGVAVSNWHPVTSISFLITHQLFETDPGAEHLINVVFHGANAALLFLVLLRLTGAGWRSAAVAAIFAWHPLRVESVCWIAERKDVLFAFFMLLALLCYAEYAQPGGTNAGRTEGMPRSWRRLAYILALLFFILSFMSKAMVVTLPFLLLLLDFWPLQRFRHVTLGSLLIEKIPFFALMIIFSVLTFCIQKSTGAVKPLEQFAMPMRLENATLSYAKYLGQFFWPSGLAILYSYPKIFDIIEVVLAALLLTAITALCILEIRRRPYLAVGWFWYLGMMVPVIGLVQIGSAPMANRYTYIPMVGPVISLVWLISEWTGANLSRKCLTASLAGGVLAVCGLLTRTQIMYWQNTVTLFAHTVDVAPENANAQCEVGDGLKLLGQLKQAAVYYRVAVAIDPKRYMAHYRLGACLKQQGYRQAALAEFSTAVSDGHDPNDKTEDVNLGIALWRMERYREAEGRLEAALRADPHLTEAMGALSWLLATCPDAGIRDGARAVTLAECACKQTGYQQAVYLSTLAAACAEAGRFDEAALTARKAIALGQSQGETVFVQRNQQYLQLYLAHKPCRQKGQ
jgi:protein O-mannosyl-transferase